MDGSRDANQTFTGWKIVGRKPYSARRSPGSSMAAVRLPLGVFLIVSLVSVTAFPNPDPLTDAELDRLGDFLKGCKGGKAMNLEELDGFFAALIAGPEPVITSEYNREVFGGEMSEVVE